MTILSANNRPTSKSLDHLFNEFFGGQYQYPATNGQQPAANIQETNESFLLEMMVPGRNKQDFKLSFEKGILSIAYESSETTKQEDVKTLRQEFNLQSFKRSFHVDETIDIEKIEARYENGILLLTLPKKTTKEEAVKTIQIL